MHQLSNLLCLWSQSEDKSLLFYHSCFGSVVSHGSDTLTHTYSYAHAAPKAVHLFNGGKNKRDFISNLQRLKVELEFVIVSLQRGADSFRKHARGLTDRWSEPEPSHPFSLMKTTTRTTTKKTIKSHKGERITSYICWEPLFSELTSFSPDFSSGDDARRDSPDSAESSPCFQR